MLSNLENFDLNQKKWFIFAENLNLFFYSSLDVSWGNQIVKTEQLK